MSATDELRKFAWKECPSKFLERVTGIADDIEQAHTMELGEVADLFKDCLPLPKDADGETIHVGDEVVDLETPRLVVAVSEDSICLAGYESGSYYRMGIAKNYRHHHEPTVEDVLREMVAAYMDTPLDDSNDGEFFAKYAAKLRLAGEDA